MQSYANGQLGVVNLMAYQRVKISNRYTLTINLTALNLWFTNLIISFQDRLANTIIDLFILGGYLLMARVLCEKCHRPLKTCICHLVTKVSNDTFVVILQHPTEVKQAKGSATLLKLSLVNSTVIVGENFNDNNELNDILARFNNKVALLYPSETALELTQEHSEIDCIIVFRCYLEKKL